MAKSGVFLLFIVLCFTPVRRAFIIESCVGTAVFGSLAYVAPKVWCRFKECCTDRWISANITGLQSALRRRVFGQHLVTETVLKAIVGHLNNKSPNKALALSFNGWTGSGKNFVSKIIAEHIFREGMESKFVHQIIAKSFTVISFHSQIVPINGQIVPQNSQFVPQKSQFVPHMKSQVNFSKFVLFGIGPL